MGTLGIEPRLSPYKEPALTVKLCSQIHQSASLLSVVCIRRKSASSAGTASGFCVVRCGTTGSALHPCGWLPSPFPSLGTKWGWSRTQASAVFQNKRPSVPMTSIMYAWLSTIGKRSRSSVAVTPASKVRVAVMFSPTTPRAGKYQFG